MMPSAKNYDAICFQLRNNFYSQLRSPLKKDLNRLSSDIKALVTSEVEIKALSTNILSQVFNLRIKALKWLTADIHFDYWETFKDIVPQIESLKSDKRFEILTENILFALRCNQRVIESIISSNEFFPDALNSSLAQLPDITYQQFIASLAFANLDDDTTRKIIDWTNASLYIEFVLVSTDIIVDKKLIVSDKTINDLAFLVADAAQDYSALATELGVLKSRSTRQSFSNLSFDSSFLKEQKQFGDLGLDDFALNIPN